MPTFYVTKYALTKGILSADFPAPDEGEGYVYGKLTDEHMPTCYYLDIDTFPSLEAAKINAEKRRRNKIDSLKKQIAKLEKLTF